MAQPLIVTIICLFWVDNSLNLLHVILNPVSIFFLNANLIEHKDCFSQLKFVSSTD